jgi:hypothetical protein
MSIIPRLNRLLADDGRCFDVAIDHGFFNERAFLDNIEIASGRPVLVRGGGKTSDEEIVTRTYQLVRSAAHYSKSGSPIPDMQVVSGFSVGSSRNTWNMLVAQELRPTKPCPVQGNRKKVVAVEAPEGSVQTTHDVDHQRIKQQIVDQQGNS